MWTPTTGAGLGPGAYMKETTFVSFFCGENSKNSSVNPVRHAFQNEPSQEQLNGTMMLAGQPQQPMSYGATAHVANNPFAYAGTIQEEPVQPPAEDSYMHGNIQDRTY